MVEATIDPYNSKESTGHPESEDKAYDEKAKKEKRTNDSLIKHLLDVTQKQKTATREVLWNRGKIKLKKILKTEFKFEFN